jgi:antitoxin component of MazEF toxin-antitoxin module
MKAQIIRFDGGLALMIPSSVAVESAFAEGTHVEVHETAAGLLITRPSVDHYIDPMLDTTQDDLHREVYWGHPSAREVVID